MFSSLSTKTLVQNKVAQADPQGKLARREGNGEKNDLGLGMISGDLPSSVGKTTGLL